MSTFSSLSRMTKKGEGPESWGGGGSVAEAVMFNGIGFDTQEIRPGKSSHGNGTTEQHTSISETESPPERQSSVNSFGALDDGFGGVDAFGGAQHSSFADETPFPAEPTPSKPSSFFADVVPPQSSFSPIKESNNKTHDSDNSDLENAPPSRARTAALRRRFERQEAESRARPPRATPPRRTIVAEYIPVISEVDNVALAAAIEAAAAPKPPVVTAADSIPDPYAQAAKSASPPPTTHAAPKVHAVAPEPRHPDKPPRSRSPSIGEPAEVPQFLPESAHPDKTMAGAPPPPSSETADDPDGKSEANKEEDDGRRSKKRSDKADKEERKRRPRRKAAKQPRFRHREQAASPDDLDEDEGSPRVIPVPDDADEPDRPRRSKQHHSGSEDDDNDKYDDGDDDSSTSSYYYDDDDDDSIFSDDDYLAYEEDSDYDYMPGIDELDPEGLRALADMLEGKVKPRVRTPVDEYGTSKILEIPSGDPEELEENKAAGVMQRAWKSYHFRTTVDEHLRALIDPEPSTSIYTDSSEAPSDSDSDSASSSGYSSGTDSRSEASAHSAKSQDSVTVPESPGRVSPIAMTMESVATEAAGAVFVPEPPVEEPPPLPEEPPSPVPSPRPLEENAEQQFDRSKPLSEGRAAVKMQALWRGALVRAAILRERNLLRDALLKYDSALREATEAREISDATMIEALATANAAHEAAEKAKRDREAALKEAAEAQLALEAYRSSSGASTARSVPSLAPEDTPVILEPPTVLENVQESASAEHGASGSVGENEGEVDHDVGDADGDADGDEDDDGQDLVMTSNTSVEEYTAFRPAYTQESFEDNPIAEQLDEDDLGAKAAIAATSAVAFAEAGEEEDAEAAAVEAAAALAVEAANADGSPLRAASALLAGSLDSARASGSGAQSVRSSALAPLGQQYTASISGVQTYYNPLPYSVYLVTIVDHVTGREWVVERRYRTWRALYQTLLTQYHTAVPTFPPRHFIGSTTAGVVEDRRRRLQLFITELLKRADLLAAPEVRDFLELDFHD